MFLIEFLFIPKSTYCNIIGNVANILSKKISEIREKHDEWSLKPDINKEVNGVWANYNDVSLN